MGDKGAKPCLVCPRIKPSPYFVDSNLAFPARVNTGNSAFKNSRRIFNGRGRIHGVPLLSEDCEERLVPARLMSDPLQVVASDAIYYQARDSRGQASQVFEH